MYVVFEGVDGTGKSTLTRNVCSVLEGMGFSVLCICEPCMDFQGNDDVERGLYFALDRYHQLESIDFDRFDFVLSDRSFYSSLAYQGKSKALREWLYTVNKFVRRPDRVFFLDCPVVEAVMRDTGSVNLVRTAFMMGVRERYLDVLPEDTVYIDCSVSSNAVRDMVIGKLLGGAINCLFFNE